MVIFSIMALCTPLRICWPQLPYASSTGDEFHAVLLASMVECCSFPPRTAPSYLALFLSSHWRMQGLLVFPSDHLFSWDHSPSQCQGMRPHPIAHAPVQLRPYSLMPPLSHSFRQGFATAALPSLSYPPLLKWASFAQTPPGPSLGPSFPTARHPPGSPRKIVSSQPRILIFPWHSFLVFRVNDSTLPIPHLFLIIFSPTRLPRPRFDSRMHQWFPFFSLLCLNLT